MAFFDGPLDVLQHIRLLEPGEAFLAVARDSVSGSVSSNRLPLVGTPHGLFGYAYRQGPAAAGTCTPFRVPDVAAASIERGEELACGRLSAIQGYDLIGDQVLVCIDGAGPPETGTLAAIDPLAFAERWSIDATTLSGAPAGVALDCQDGAMDAASREVIVAANIAGGGAFVASVDLDAHDVTWTTNLDDTRLNSPSPVRLPDSPAPGTLRARSAVVTPNGIAVVGVHPALGTMLYVLDRTGLVQNWWTARDAGVIAGTTPAPRTPPSANSFGAATATSSGNLVAMQFSDTLRVIELPRGNMIGGTILPTVFNFDGSLAWSGDRLIVLTGDLFRAYDPGDLVEPVWAAGLDGLPQALLVGPPGDAFVLSISQFITNLTSDDQRLVRYDLSNGEIRQVFRFDFPNQAAVGLYPLPDGSGMILWGDKGNVTMLGRAPPELLPGVAISPAYPRPGEVVTLHVAPAAAGTPDHYQISWGEGAAIDVANDIPATHQYSTDGVYQAAVTAHYTDGRTGTTQFVVDVGGSPPPELTPLQEAFSPDNQNTTWGIIGLLIALAGAIVALTRRRTRRGRLHRELEAIQRAYDATEREPLRCEAALAERKSRVRTLLLAGKLDDGQAALLEKRIDELARDLRLKTLDASFQFLPHGLVLTMRDMLADGRINGWERQHVLAALEADRILTGAQKAKVRALIDEWAARDAGRAERGGGRA